MTETVVLTYSYRVKDKHAATLNRMARAVNSVWNHANEVQKHALKWGQRWPSGFDLEKTVTGSSKLLGLTANTIGLTCQQYEQSRKQHKRPFLRYRTRRSLGWIPMRAPCVRLIGDAVRYNGQLFKLWLSRPLPEGATICDRSSFSQDRSGRWFVHVAVRVPASPRHEELPPVGIDLGLKDLATLSTGERIAAPQFFRRSERKLAVAQRARKKRQTREVHRKIANQRRDFLHKATTNIVRRHGTISVGGVSASKLARTRMAKSVLDAGWSSFRTMLAYKSIANGVSYLEVNEAYSTQTCSECGSIGGPKGRKGLVIREWACGQCGTVHDRDVNAARNILRYEHVSPKGRAA